MTNEVTVNSSNSLNVNVVKVVQQPEKPVQLRLNSVTVCGENDEALVLTTNEQNYYRASGIFGDIATKKDEYPNQGFIESALNLMTKATAYVEDVVVNVQGFFTSETAKDAKMSDIFAKQIGIWTKEGKTVSGGFALEDTDAYRFALSVNSDDYTTRESVYKGNKEEHEYFDVTKSDNNITLFSTEEIDGKEYIAMRDGEGNVHYFDKSDNLKAVN